MISMKDLKVKNFVGQLYKTIVFLFLNFLFIVSASAQDYKTIKAEKGEGVYSLLRRSGLAPEQYLKTFVELNKSKLGTDNSLYVGETYKLPLVEESDEPLSSMVTESLANGNSANTKANTSTGKTTTYSIFGEKYKNVTQIDSELSGAAFYLVSGHGGPDPGAVGRLGNNSLCEDEYAYDVTLRLARVLIEHGALVYMITRDENDGIRDMSILKPDSDETCYPSLTIPRNQVSRLKQRTNAVNKLYTTNKGKTQRMVIIHVDSRSKGENIDVFFYHDKRSKTGKKLAINLQQTFKEKYDLHQPNRGYHGTVSDRNLYVLKNSYPPAVFIELGNINHTRDQQRFMLENNRQALANWLAAGLITDFNNNK